MIGTLVLGAGSSRRFGDDKRKAKLPDGRFVLGATCELALEVFDEVILVLRKDDAEFQTEMDMRISHRAFKTFRATDSDLGMGHSLANAIQQAKDWDGCFVSLGDMPFIKRETLQALKSQVTHDNIVVPFYEGERGHPVGFGRGFFHEVALTVGDQGAKSVIANHMEACREVQVTDEGVLRDIDTPDDIN